MRLLLFTAAVMLATLPARAAAPDLDEVVMQNIEAVNESLSSSLALKDATASATDARDLDQLFAEVETYFVNRGDAADALDYTRRSREAAAGILRAIGESKFDAASELAVDISRTCKTCHRKYKPD